MDEEIQIRTAKAVDAEALTRLASRLFRQTYSGLMPNKDLEAYIADDFSQQQQSRELSDPDVLTLLALNRGELVGYAQLRNKPIPLPLGFSVTLELWRIYLDHNNHGQGIGGLLFAEIARSAQQLNSRKLWLGVWEQNHRAIAFYQKHGFQKVGQQDFVLGSEVHNDIILLGDVATI